jgi:hypothetical protein
MEHMRRSILLSNGRLDSSSQKKKNQQGGAEHTRAEPIHEKSSMSTSSQYENGDACRSVIPITSHGNANFALAARSAK